MWILSHDDRSGPLTMPRRSLNLICKSDCGGWQLLQAIVLNELDCLSAKDAKDAKDAKCFWDGGLGAGDNYGITV